MAAARKMNRRRALGGLERLCEELPSPLRPLHGRRGAPLALPDNVVCYCRSSAAELARQGRAVHPCFVLIFALETAATVCFEHRSVRLRPGQGLVLPPFRFHRCVEPARDSLRWLFVTFELIDPRSAESLRERPFVLTAALRSTLADLIEAYLNPAQEELVSIFAGILLSRIRQAGSIRRNTRRPTALPELLVRVDRLARSPGGPVGVKAVATALGVSPSHLGTTFRQMGGVSIGRHLRRLRLERGRGLLRLSHDRVTDIAEECGFGSINSFIRAFRSAYGVLPLAYRKKAGPKPLREEPKVRIQRAGRSHWSSAPSYSLRAS